MYREVDLQDTVQILLLRGEASHDFIHLRNNSSEKGCGGQEQEYAVHLCIEAGKDMLSPISEWKTGKGFTYPLSLTACRYVSCIKTIRKALKNRISST
jgi:hypothetical protein